MNPDDQEKNLAFHSEFVNSPYQTMPVNVLPGNYVPTYNPDLGYNLVFSDTFSSQQNPSGTFQNLQQNHPRFQERRPQYDLYYPPEYLPRNFFASYKDVHNEAGHKYSVPTEQNSYPFSDEQEDDVHGNINSSSTFYRKARAQQRNPKNQNPKHGKGFKVNQRAQRTLEPKTENSAPSNSQPSDSEAAVQRATQAFKGPWQKYPSYGKANFVNKREQQMQPSQESEMVYSNFVEFPNRRSNYTQHPGCDKWKHKNNYKGLKGSRQSDLADVRRGTQGVLSENNKLKSRENAAVRAATAGKRAEDKLTIRTFKKMPVGAKKMDDENQRDLLTDQLVQGIYECMVCCCVIRCEVAIWSCSKCFHIFHLWCIKKWARSAVAIVEGNKWRCPACQMLTDRIPYQYQCFCGQAVDPEWNHFYTPHSCGEVCRKDRGKHCSHPCNSLCHPGPCPPCGSAITMKCKCGRSSQMLKCGHYKGFQCSEVCGSLLSCGKHLCEVVCHDGPCKDCEVIIKQDCYGSHVERYVSCGGKEDVEEADGFSCGQPCKKLLECGKHYCNDPCHKGSCAPCQLLPTVLTHCPCGKTALNELSDQPPRTLCTDPLPTCGRICNKVLPCGPKDAQHCCKQKCHEGMCKPCDDVTLLKCRCKSYEKQFSCSEIRVFNEDKPFLCNKRCHKKRTCGKHKCHQPCCVKTEHPCDQICGWTLSCGKHKCDQLCHRGNCRPCLQASFDELMCHCGMQVIEPPVPCGARPPECSAPCARQHSCDHPVHHNCHADNICPPCTELTAKVCMGGHETRRNIPCHIASISCGMPCNKELLCKQHKCKKTCHKGPCQNEGEQCTQPCSKIRRECGHPCKAPCHLELDCPKIPCKVEITVRCPCGSRTAQVPCLQSGDDTSRILQYQKITLESLKNMEAGIDMSQFSKGGPKSSPRQIECDKECTLKERNRRMALALEIRNPDLSAKLGNPTYSQFLKDFAKQHAHSVSTTEKALSDLVQDAKKSKKMYKTHSFPPMNRDNRRMIHELAQHYGCETQSYDSEPNKNVVAIAHRDKSWLPSVTLTSLVQRELHPKAPLPIPHVHKEDDLRRIAQAAKQSTEVLDKRGSDIKHLKEENPHKKLPLIDYFDFTG